MIDTISILISSAALGVSFLTLYLSIIKKGEVKMTRPSTVFFGPDGGRDAVKKVYIRTLLYNTSEKGQYVQNMFIRLQRGESIQNFNIWIYDETGRHVRGSGLFVDKKGIVANHHFLLPNDNDKYKFLTGTYNLQVFIELVDKIPFKIFEQKFNITKLEQDQLLNDNRAGIYFDWTTNNQNYSSHIKSRPLTKNEFLEAVT